IKGAAGDVWNFLGNLSPVEWVSSLWKGIKDKVSGAFGDGLFKDLGLGPIKHAWDSVKEWILDKIGLGPGGDEGSANASAKPASQWRPQVMRALSMLGYPSSWAGATLKQIQIESGGDPNAINRWDINARRGTPSQGLLQTIPGTFQANKYPGYNNITGPLDNILAALRYTVRRYGSVPAIWPTRAGYDDGGWLQPGVTAAVNKTRAPEPVLSSAQWRTAERAIAASTTNAAAAPEIDYDRLAAAMANANLVTVLDGREVGRSVERHEQWRQVRRTGSRL
ncbi:MAG TPA: transglycosylase SLT domain-containing protein, partial [Beutenbergiaceae bacterium]|nr:transglycosylase SLT domain-containing protein [Beutenbergiaceae bacterium]